MPMSTQASNRVQYSQMKLRGGLDLVTPTLDLPSGFLRACENFEVSETGGYRRCDGYERFDGRPKPSDASFTIVQINAYTNTPTVGQTLTDAGTAATGVIVSVQTNYMVLTKVVGTHTIGNLQNVGATPIGTMVTPTVTLNALLVALYKSAAAENYRADITAPTGAGPLLGVATLVTSGTTDNTYAFRNNVGNTAQDIWKSSTSGWVNVPLYREVAFTVGLGSGAGNVVPPADGEILTETVGGETATIKRVVHRSGSWAAGTAAGYFVITTPAPSELEGGASTISGGATCTTSGPSTAIVIQPYTSGNKAKYEMFVWNFSGQASGLRLYGCDGVNTLFEFDGDVYVPIRTGTTPDTPKHAAVMANHLFGAFKSSAIHSAPGEPFNWTAGTGLGSEIATGDTITGFMPMQGTQSAQTLSIYGTRQSSMLYGTDTSTWSLTRFDSGVGAVDYSVQRMLDAYSLDDPGVIKLSAVQDFGNFTASSLTANILPYIKRKRTLLANSTVAREKSQYRLFFTDTTGLFITMVNGKYLGAAPQRFQHTVYSASNSDSMRVGGNPDIFFGSSDGYVMQLDKGTSFDGSAIDAYWESNWETMGKPRIVKRFLKAALEAQGTAYINFTLAYSLGYGSASIKEPDGLAYTINASATPIWDAADLFWDLFTWDGNSFDIPSEIELKGRGETIKYRISSGTNYIASYTVNSIFTHYEDGRRMR